ncbi:MAG: 50S ribosome-binding GTPase, partial [Bacteroidales bacterium]|nr:50S ribosome-binding GTPase [Bacteroidales bacterium]
SQESRVKSRERNTLHPTFPHPGLGEGGRYHDESPEAHTKPLPEGKTLTFALAGNQNCGKTTLFNQLTGANQHVGNFPGVTVEHKFGNMKGHPEARVVDLPGIYSLSPYTSEEVVSRRYILDEHPTAIIDIADATNIERNLYLTLQLMELGVPMVLSLNMMDELKANGGSIRINEMEQLLGIPVVPISAMKNEGVDDQHQCQVISNLLVIGLDLETHGKSEKNRSQERLRKPTFPTFNLFKCAAVCEDEGRQSPWEEGYGLHLGVVSDLDDLEIVRAERYRDGSSCRQHGVDAEGKQQQEPSQQGNEQVCSRPFPCQQGIIDGLRPVTLPRCGDDGRGHSTEHRICPIGWVVRMGLIPFVHLVRHSDIAGDVALVHDLTAQHLWDEGVGDDEEKQDDTRERQYSFQSFAHITVLVLLSWNGAGRMPAWGSCCQGPRRSACRGSRPA